VVVADVRLLSHERPREDLQALCLLKILIRKFVKIKTNLLGQGIFPEHRELEVHATSSTMGKVAINHRITTGSSGENNLIYNKEMKIQNLEP